MSVERYPGRRTVQPDMPDERRHRQEMARAIQQLFQGQNNATLQVTLDADVTATTVEDARISQQTAAVLVPMTADAAAALGTTYCVPSAGQLIINHGSAASTDRTFQLALIG